METDLGNENKISEKDISAFPKLDISIALDKNNYRSSHELSEETIFSAIENDLNNFSNHFENDLQNDPLTDEEKAIIKSYLWWKTKRYYNEFKEELCGMCVDATGTVSLIATGSVVSYISSNGIRLPNFHLSQRGRTDHDILVQKWEYWKSKHHLCIYKTKIVGKTMRKEKGL